MKKVFFWILVFVLISETPLNTKVVYAAQNNDGVIGSYPILTDTESAIGEEDCIHELSSIDSKLTVSDKDEFATYSSGGIAAVAELFWPVRNSSGDCITAISSHYGSHAGIDIKNAAGCNWYAAYDGKVYRVYKGCISNGYDTGGHVNCNPNHGRKHNSITLKNGITYSGDYCNDSFGNGVIIQSTIGGENYYFQCAHMNSVSLALYEGQTIKAGTYLGTVGDRGFSFGTHAHFEVDKGKWYGAPVNNDPTQSGCMFSYNYSSITENADTTSPSISNVLISDLSSDGYTVSCVATDDVDVLEVKFPTWTSTDQNDLIWHEGVHSGGRWSYNVKSSEHNNVEGNYTTHVYAWDAAGNYAMYCLSPVFVDKTDPVIGTPVIKDMTSDGYTVEVTVTDNGTVDRVMFPTWTEKNGQDDLVSGWTTSDAVRGTKSGNKYSFHVNTSDHNNEHGNYKTHIYAFDKCGNNAINDSIVVFVDNKNPVIGTPQVKNIDSTGYTVEVAVTDNGTVDRVMFPTWTEKKGQDDLADGWTTSSALRGTKSGDKYSFRVKVSDHNNEYGKYYTHIYAFDACGNYSVDDSIEVLVPQIIKVTGISLNKTEATIEVNNTEKLSATIIPSDATNKNVTWSSSNNSIATIDSEGVITARQTGTVQITAKSVENPSIKADCSVTVIDRQISVTGITLTKSSTTLTVGESEILTANIIPDNATNKRINWSSADESVATVDNMGTISAIKAGKVLITAASAEDGSIKAVCEVTVNDSIIKVTGISLNETSMELKVGQSENLTAIIEPENASNKGIIWNSANTSIAVVDDSGIVTAKQKGTTQIIAQSAEDQAIWAVCIVEVSDPSSGGNNGEELQEPQFPGDLPPDKEVPEGIWIDGVYDLTYDGTRQTQDFHVYDGAKLLVENTDYSITYKNNQKAYTINDLSRPTDADKKYAPQVILTMKGNYSGKETAYYSIEPLSIEDDTAFSAYLKGSGAKQKPVLMWNGKALKAQTDYTVSSVGSVITLTGTGNFTGTRTIDASAGTALAQINMSKVKVSPIPAQVFKGSAYGIADLKAAGGASPFVLTVSNGAEELKEGVDYRVVKIVNGTKVGTATIVLRGLNAGGTEGASINSFVGEKRVTFKITGYPMLGADISVTGEDGSGTLSAPYCKAGAKPALKVRFGETVLKEGRDYTLKYNGNTKYPSTTASVVIMGKGNFAGKKTVPFSVTQRPFTDAAGITVVAGDKAVGKKANQYQTSVKVFDAEGKLLKAGTDYEKTIAYLQGGLPLSATSFPQAGEKVTVRVTGKGGYSDDSIDAEYTILPAGAVTDIAKATIQIKDHQYDKGRAIEITSPDQIKQAFIGKNKTPLTLSEDGVTGDFMVVPGSYVKNTAKGTASVTFMGINGYSGAKTVKFKIGARSIIGNWFGWLF